MNGLWREIENKHYYEISSTIQSNRRGVYIMRAMKYNYFNTLLSDYVDSIINWPLVTRYECY